MDWILLIELIPVVIVFALLGLRTTYYFANPDEFKYNQGLFGLCAATLGFMLLGLDFSIPPLDGYVTSSRSDFPVATLENVVNIIQITFLTALLPAAAYYLSSVFDPRVSKSPYRNLIIKSVLTTGLVWTVIGLLYLSCVHKVDVLECKSADEEVVRSVFGNYFRANETNLRHSIIMPNGYEGLLSEQPLTAQSRLPGFTSDAHVFAKENCQFVSVKMDFLSWSMSLAMFCGYVLFVPTAAMGLCIMIIGPMTGIGKTDTKPMDPAKVERSEYILQDRAIALHSSGDQLMERINRLPEKRGFQYNVSKRQIKSKLALFDEAATLLEQEFEWLDAQRRGIPLTARLVEISKIVGSFVVLLTAGLVYVYLIITIFIRARSIQKKIGDIGSFLVLMGNGGYMLTALVYYIIFGIFFAASLVGLRRLTNGGGGLFSLSRWLPVEPLKKQNTYMHTIMFHLALATLLSQGAIMFSWKLCARFLDIPGGLHRIDDVVTLTLRKDATNARMATCSNYAPSSASGVHFCLLTETRLIGPIYRKDILEWIFVILFTIALIYYTFSPPTKRMSGLEDRDVMFKWGKIHKHLGLQDGDEELDMIDKTATEDADKKNEPPTREGFGTRLKQKVQRAEAKMENGPQSIMKAAVFG